MSPFEPSEGVPVAIGDYTDPIIVQGRSGVLQIDFEDTALSSATVTVKNDAGTTLVNAQPAEGSEGVFGYQLGASHTASLDRLSVEWKSGEEKAETFVDIAGARIISLSDLEEELPSGVTASQEELASARILAEMAIEDACYVSFVPRFRREVNDRGVMERGRIRSLRQVKVNGVAIPSVASVRVVNRRYIPKAQFFSTFWGDSTLLYPPSLSPQVVEVAYEHGWDQPPAPVVRATMRLAAYHLTPDPSNYDARATSISTDEAHYSLVTPGVGSAVFPLPEVNMVVQRYGLGCG